MAQSDWLLTGQDLQFFLLQFNEMLFADFEKS
jgi:hypothetical protein